MGCFPALGPSLWNLTLLPDALGVSLQEHDQVPARPVSSKIEEQQMLWKLNRVIHLQSPSWYLSDMTVVTDTGRKLTNQTLWNKHPYPVHKYCFWFEPNALSSLISFMA